MVNGKDLSAKTFRKFRITTTKSFSKMECAINVERNHKSGNSSVP